MRNIRSVAVCTISAFVISALPIQINVLSKTLDTSVAYAKGGNGKGKGNGSEGGIGGNGYGKNGNSGSKGGGALNGKSGSTNGRGKGSQRQVASSSFGKAFRSVFGTDKKLAEKRREKSRIRSSKANSRKTQLASLPETVLTPDASPKQFHAKMAALNSLKRNYHAYLNSKSPRFAAVRAFVMASAEYEIALDNVKAAEQEIAAAEQDFSGAVTAAGITPFDGVTGVYADATVESLNDRLDTLKVAQVSPDQEAALQVEIDAVESLLAGKEASSIADAKAEHEAALATAAAAAVGTDDEDLRQALLDMANKNRVARYGDDYVDTEMMDWAKEVLGVDDAFGKIDEVRAELDPEK